MTSGLVANSSVLIFGTAGGQAIALLSTLLFTRVLTPEDLGIFGIFGSIVAVSSIVTSLGFEQAIIRSNSSDAFTLLGLTCAVSIIGNALVTVILLVVLLTPAFPTMPLWFPWLVGLVGAAANVFTAAHLWYARERRFRRAGLGDFSLNASRGLFSVALAFLMRNAVSLPLGELAGRLVGIAVLDKQRAVPASIVGIVRNPHAATAVAKNARRVASLLMPGTMLESIYFWLPLTLSSLTFGTEAAGYVALCQRLTSGPLSLVGRNVAIVLGVKISREGGSGEVDVAAARWTLAAMGVPFFCGWLILLMWGPEIFAALFGPHWATAGTIMAAMAPLAAFQMAWNVITRLLVEAHLEHLKLIAFATMTVVSALVFQVSSPIFGLVGTIAIYSAVGCLLCIAFIWLSFRSINRQQIAE